jgi:periplasmic protein CpxP/Spy
MKSLKLIVLATALGAVFTPVMRAQADKAPSGEGKKGGGRGGMNAEAQVARIDEAVKLTADQKTKITAILTKVQSDVMALPQDERRTKGMELRQAANKEIRALLTDEQKTKFDAMPPAGGGGRGEGKKKDK